MKKIPLLAVGFVLAAYFLFPAAVYLQETKSVKLPKPQMDIGRPLMQVLNDRKTGREFSNKELSEQDLSNLLWAAFGINRPESGKRTAPSARNLQEIDIYIATAGGLYLFDAKTNTLNLVVEKDIRAVTGRQPFVKDAPVNLIYVADYSRMGEMPDETKEFYSATHTGFISQNVYLYCASEGLSTVVRGSIDRETLSKAMKLRADQKVVLAQTVGYPKE